MYKRFTYLILFLVDESYQYNPVFIGIDVDGNVIQSFEFLNLTQCYWKFEMPARFRTDILYNGDTRILDVYFLESGVERQ